MNRNKLFLIPIFIISVLFTIKGYAQDHHEKHKHSHKNEISIAVGIVPLVAEDKLTGGIHLHYIRGIGKTNRFGIGAAVETILDEHKHITISAAFQYRVYKGLIFGYGPGLLIRKEGSETEYQFAQHFEVAWEFELGKFHLGPMAEVGFEKNGVHYMIGIHFGLDF